jgi:ketosteroid isomerase-like protein
MAPVTGGTLTGPTVACLARRLAVPDNRGDVARAKVSQRTNRELCLALLDTYRPNRLDELLELLDPSIEWVTTEGWIERETWRGRAAVRAGLQSFFDEWQDFSHELLEFRDAGDRFAVTTRMHGKHRLTGIHTEMATGGVCEVMDGRPVRIVGYSDPEAALAAVEPTES